MATKKKSAKRTKKMGRPTKFTAKLGKEICDRIAGGESLRVICKDEKMPARSNIHSWLLKGVADRNDEENKTSDYAKFQDQYESAMDMRADLMFEELEEIADDGSNDWMEKELNNGKIIDVVDHEHVQRSRLRVDTRKWILARMKPKKYNDKHVHVTEDEDGKQMPITGNAIEFAPQNKDESES